MRDVICADAVEWMAVNKNAGAVVTSLPDADECGWSIEFWRNWFIDAAALSMQVARDDCPAIFYQTDRKSNGAIISKAFLCHSAAERLGYRPLWHKIVLRREVGATDLFRPTYTHLMAFSKDCPPGKASPDVIQCGRMIYENAMGLNAAILAVTFAGKFSNTIIDPFCGRGTVLAIANAYGYKSIGVDILPEQCEKARTLKITRRE
jgi:hypothetical protein